MNKHKTITAHAIIQGVSFTAMQAMMLHEAQEHDLDVLENDTSSVKIASSYGTFGLTSLSDAVQLNVEGYDKDGLFLIRESLVEHLEHFLPEIAQSIRWSDAPSAGSTPPNFHFAEVIERRDLCQDFYRVTLHVANAKMFDAHSIHFRFVLPQPFDASPEWPQLKENGSINWPKGDKELHRPVYTIAGIDCETRQIEVDIFRHEGGRMTTWAQNAMPGDRVGLIGPGGGGALSASNVLLGGDETAFPAIARIVEALPSNATGSVILLNRSGAFDYPMPRHSGLTLKWLNAQDAPLWEAILDVYSRFDHPYIWFAADAEQVKKLRGKLKPMDAPKGNSYLGTFWH